MVLVGGFFIGTFSAFVCPSIHSPLFGNVLTWLRASIKRPPASIGKNQPAGLTSILLLTKIPGFALFANSVALSRAAWERTVPDSVISFLSAIAFTLRSAIFN